MRTALLAAVSHDLRTPLASAKAAVTSLRSDDVDFSDEDRDELLATADESLDRLSRLVANLLDMSRLQAGALGVAATDGRAGGRRPARAGRARRGAAARSPCASPTTCPPCHADPGLLERVLVNLIRNALRYSPPDRPPHRHRQRARRPGRAARHRPRPGHPRRPPRPGLPAVPAARRPTNDTGVGLGLALSRGLAEAMGGTLAPETTPGGGLTMVLTLPATQPPVAASEAQASMLADRAIVERIHHRPRNHEGTS